MIIPPLPNLLAQSNLTVFWFRRDLRLQDNHGLYQALKASDKVLPLFIFDTYILSKLDNRADLRIQFIYSSVRQLKIDLENIGSTLLVAYGTPIAVYQELVAQLDLRAVYTNHDYEPYARKRDQAVASYLATHQVAFHHYKDQVIFEQSEVVKDDRSPYTVFTPYMRKWKSVFQSTSVAPFRIDPLYSHFVKTTPLALCALRDLGFTSRTFTFPSKHMNVLRIRKYDQQRDIPAILGTSRLGIHLRHGTISVRSVIAFAYSHNMVWLNELIWREFYMMILWYFPHVCTRAFKPAYDAIPWENNLAYFQAWCDGRTGYPIVDAGMRELNYTGYMHNRLRMITASFLTKHLLIDWRWGEAYFAGKLLDFELSSNNGGWQWTFGGGCDAAPYFRIFNPYLQAKKFDPLCIYTKRWVPELNTTRYPPPIVDHRKARMRALEVYKEGLQATIT